MNRRQFMILSIAVVAGFELGSRQAGAADTATTTAPSKSPLPADAFDAGPIGNFPHSGVYDEFREEGFFIIRRAQEVFAMSSICTHRGCKIRLQDDLSYHCFCHGSIYDPDGHVVRGPSKRDLPRLAVAEHLGHLLVRKT